VTSEIEKHLLANMNMSKKNIMLSNFLGGLAWGFGTVVGASAVVAVIGYILSLFGFFDFINLPQPQLYR